MKLVKVSNKAPVKIKEPPKFYQYRQNNSGGKFRGPAINVIVEAHSSEDANMRAEQFGLYFSGCDTGQDCDCCGNRWSDSAYNDCKDEPCIYDTPIAQFEVDAYLTKRKEKIPFAIVLFLDGSTDTYTAEE